MSLDALHVLISEAEGFEPFAARLERRNELLAEAYAQLAGSRWQRLSALATEVVALDRVWRRHRFDPQPPSNLSEIQLLIWRAARISGRLPPGTSRGLAHALKCDFADFNSSTGTSW